MCDFPQTGWLGDIMNVNDIAEGYAIYAVKR